MTTETSFLPTGAESESTSSTRQQLLQSFRTSKEYRHAFVEEAIRTGLAAQTRAIREMRKMAPKTFAEKLNRKVSWIYRLEDPNAPAPTIASLLEEAKAFDVDLQVRFRPFSERLDELSKLSEKSFGVPSFDEELSLKRAAEALVESLSKCKLRNSLAFSESIASAYLQEMARRNDAAMTAIQNSPLAALQRESKQATQVVRKFWETNFPIPADSVNARIQAILSGASMSTKVPESQPTQPEMETTHARLMLMPKKKRGRGYGRTRKDSKRAA